MAPSELVTKLGAEGYGYEAAGFTEINNTCALIDLQELCAEAGITPAFGVDFRNLKESAACLYVGYAQSQLGFARLNAFLSKHLHAKTSFLPRAPMIEGVVWVYPLERDVALEALRMDEFVGIGPWQINKLRRLDPGLLQSKGVAFWPVSFAESEDFYTHCLLRSIEHNCLLSKLERKHAGFREEVMPTKPELLKTYEGLPFLVQNANEFLERCAFRFDLSSEKNKLTHTGSMESDSRLLRELAFAGIEHRYAGRPTYDEAIKRCERELGVIAKKNFVAYFLTAWDVIQYAKRQGYFYAGRGSGANSIVAYGLTITEVDPISLDLFFERFLNMHRASPPDFDLDFSWQDRDDIFRYLFEKHGPTYTAMLGSHSTLKFRAVARELGKVYGLPKGEIDDFINGAIVAKQTGKPLTQTDRYREKITQMTKRLGKFPRHMSLHASGLVISEDPIFYHTSTSLPPKGLPATHFDMYTAEKYKLFKLDILSQRGLGHIKDSIQLVYENQGIEVDIHKTQDFFEDPRLNDRLATGDTVGCFYIESPAMRQLLSKLKCSDFRTLVAASSIIRPGVSGSGMMREYIVRHNNPTTYVPIHPRLDELLGETYGVMVYQEDIIRVAHHFAGLDLPEADILRRAMAWKFRVDNGFDKMEASYFESCEKQGYTREVAEEVWRQMMGFASFSFCKAHSASYAVESYQSLFLKEYYPLEFSIAVVNNFGGFYSTEFYINEFRRLGGVMHPPCVNRSDRLTNLLGRDAFLGFIHVKGFTQKSLTVLLEERVERGPFASLADFHLRTGISREQLLILVRVGAFQFTGKGKHELQWEALLLTTEAPSRSATLFEPETRNFELPALPQRYALEVLDQIELIGFPLCSPFSLVAEPLKDLRKARDLPEFVGKSIFIYGYTVATRALATSTGKYMQFVTFVDERGDPFECTVFPQAFEKFQFSRHGVYVYELFARVAEDFEVATLELISAKRLTVSFE